MGFHINEKNSPTVDIQRPDWGAGERGTRYLLIHPGVGSTRMHMNSQVLPPRSVAGPYHYHPDSDSAYYILAGRARMIVNGEEFLAESSEAIFIPAGEHHAILNVGDENLHFLEFRVPPNKTLIEVPRPDGLRPGDRPAR